MLGAVFCAPRAPRRFTPTWAISAAPDPPGLVGLVLPALLLCYAGQTALSLIGAGSRRSNPFFDLCPASLQVPLVALATVATVIASQSIITGAFSMTRQAVQLGLLPRIQISQTSAQSYGQIYVGFVNWADGAHAGPDRRVPLVRQSRRGVRHRRLDDDAADEPF